MTEVDGEVADVEVTVAVQGLPEPVAAELMRLSSEHGGLLTPEIVVTAARDRSSPLHTRFTWNNREAAERRRLDEARSLIRRFRIQVITTEGITVVPRFVSVKVQDGERVRVPVENAMGDRGMRRQVLVDSQRQLLGMQRRLRGLEASQ